MFSKLMSYPLFTKYTTLSCPLLNTLIESIFKSSKVCSKRYLAAFTLVKLSSYLYSIIKTITSSSVRNIQSPTLFKYSVYTTQFTTVCFLLFKINNRNQHKTNKLCNQCPCNLHLVKSRNSFYMQQINFPSNLKRSLTPHI